MDPILFERLVVGGIAILSAQLGAGLVWWRTRRRIGDLEHALVARLDTDAADGTIADLTHQIQVLTEQIDRLSEAQDFVARVLTETLPKRVELPPGSDQPAPP